MNLDIREQLDPLFEIMGLLYVSSNGKQHKEQTIIELDKFGIDGEAFYNKNLKVIDKYVQAFQKHQMIEDSDRLFFTDETYFSVLLALLCENANWLTELEEVSEDRIREALLQVLIQEHSEQHSSAVEGPQLHVRSLDEIISFLEECPFEEGVKWKLMSLLQQPRKHMSALVSAVTRNLPAFEHACKEVEKPLGKLIPKLVQSIHENGDKRFLKLIEFFTRNSTLHPTLIMPLGQVMYVSQCYCGLYVASLPISGNYITDSREYLLMRLKALADNSKLQILSSLKASPKYNLEIAEQLGLSAATVSHHMNVLLASGMVGIDKKNSKVHYHLETDNIRLLIDELERYLL
ncbi:ArsR/SmtB family transcription factor [Paenibacillus riograndensis]|uniref:Transcriptional regulator, ArsR family n=1 Tax=Paenibacillus riograndensis SBR5 TaxID=1073571 RepID=A0A0E4CWF6_9BACL|nr:metalloregulator ArsR/SmtB family transcription factor [Paenibacillus riograndensis]CQR55226.1 transcriptional regulator, ArsR family [Paenibacillus riograndensis SBR5]